MFMEERQAKILEILSKDGKVLVKELAEKFGVTEDSIRKDLGTLEMEGQLKRTYGGAVAIQEKLHVAELNRRRIREVEAKRKIAATAMRLITTEDLIFLDTSTISIAIAEILEKSEMPYKILTNMIDVLVMLAKNPKINLIFGGGQINKNRDGFLDGLNLEFMTQFRPSVAFIGVVGVDIEKNSLTTNDSNSGIHKRRMIELSKKIYIMAESSKMGTEGNFKFSTLNKVRGLITETSPSQRILELSKKMQLEIILPE